MWGKLKKSQLRIMMCVEILNQGKFFHVKREIGTAQRSKNFCSIIQDTSSNKRINYSGIKY
jgi:hypothetical protein